MEVTIELEPRRKRAIEMIANSKPYKAIASELGVSMTRVKQLVASVYCLPGTKDRIELTIWAVRNGLKQL